MEAHRDPEIRRTLNHALMNLPDGMPMSWVGYFQGLRNMDRVFGPDLMMAMCRLSAEQGYRNFLYGGKPGVAELLSNTIKRKMPGLQVVVSGAAAQRISTKSSMPSLRISRKALPMR
jgi:N-acetylglucosaminyldiphosphoundecaprenol N-acetyl-beta-D-mannosaminyltransferase